MGDGEGEMRNLGPEGRYADVVADLKKLPAEWEGQLEPAPLNLRKEG